MKLSKVLQRFLEKIILFEGMRIQVHTLEQCKAVSQPNHLKQLIVWYLSTEQGVADISWLELNADVIWSIIRKLQLELFIQQ